MKKQIVTACALIASVAAFATSVESSNTFGVLKIASTATAEKSAQLIIPVPWENVGTASGVIDPTAYVLTTNRKKDDTLFYYDTQQKAYKVWSMSADGSSSGVWTAQDSYNISDKALSTITADGTFARGKAVILQLVKGSTEPVYISGQYSSNLCKVAITGPAASAHAWWVVYNLIAPSSASAVSLSDVQFFADENCLQEVGVNDIVGDKIVKADGTTYYCEAGDNSSIKWVYYAPGTPGTVSIPIGTTENVKLNAGEGAWYVRAVHKNGAQTIYVKW